jgi:hypothetical protein
MNHTTGGAFSWKFGSVGLGTYAPMGDGALETRPVVFDGIDASLTFWHMISAETASYMEAHDGGLVEMSVDGGPWTQLLPLGGYGYRIVNRAQDPGPFPDGTAVYSGTYFWRQASFRLLDLVGQVRFRFRFGSDGEGGGTGWLIDDIEILPDEPNLSGTDAFEEIPQTLMLHPSMPSPLAPATGARIAFDLPQTLPVRLGVFDVGGRLVRVLVHETLPAGAYSVVWDGRDEADRALASGVYFYILDAGRRELVQRTLLIR